MQSLPADRPSREIAFAIVTPEKAFHMSAHELPAPSYTVPACFITDFASIPRPPTVLFGEGTGVT